MLANDSNNPDQFGTLSRELQKPATFRHELLDFISEELPRWRDRADRPNVTGETVLTSQLCAHLNSAARHSEGWDILQFRVEEPDEQSGGRKIDLIASPSDTSILIEGRKHIDFDSLMPIECKRLPTPRANDRDEREYVISRYSSTGGIQRFKAGHHGASHKLAAMIAYVQQETRGGWNQRIAGWISDLVRAGHAGWTTGDLIEILEDDDARGLSIARSSHTRDNGLEDIEIRHMWISMI